MSDLEHLIEINQQLKNRNYIDTACEEGLLAERALILGLNANFPISFSFLGMK